MLLALMEVLVLHKAPRITVNVQLDSPVKTVTYKLENVVERTS